MSSQHRSSYKPKFYQAPPGTCLFSRIAARSQSSSRTPTSASSSPRISNTPIAKPTVLASRPTPIHSITSPRKFLQNSSRTKLASRRPKAGCEIAPSVYRPHVGAGDRLIAWTTPYSESQLQNISSSLPLKVIDLSYDATWAGLADSTKNTYGAGLLRYNQFCDSMDIPESQRMPTSDYLLAGFIGFHMGKASNSCVKGWLSGLRAWHDLAGAPWPAESRILRFARAGARVAGAHLRRPMRNPITIQHMLALYFALNFTIPFHCAIWVVACLAFWGCRRLGELTVPSRSKFNPKYHVLRSTPISFARKPDRSVKAVLFRVPWTKTTKEVGAPITGTVQSGQMKLFCPVNAIQLHLRANASVPPEFSLFGYIDADGKPIHMVKSVFLGFCQAAWEKKGLFRVQGHSFRIGGAVELLIAGVPPEIVASLGGWDSLAFLIYWRRFEEIIPTHIFKAYDPEQISRLKSTIDDFRKTHNIPDSVIEACINGVDLEAFE